MDLRIHKTLWFLRSWAPGRLSSTIIVNYTDSTREQHKRNFFLIAELPEAFLPAREKTRSQNGSVDKGSKWTKIRFFFKCMLLSKKSLNVTEKAFRRWLGEGLKYHIFGISNRCFALTIRVKKVHLQGNRHTLVFTHPRTIQPFYQKVSTEGLSRASKERNRRLPADGNPGLTFIMPFKSPQGCGWNISTTLNTSHVPTQVLSLTRSLR